MDIHLNRGRAFPPLFRPPRAGALSARNQPKSRAMHLLRIAWQVLLLTLLLLFPSSALLGQEFGDSVTRDGTVKETFISPSSRKEMLSPPARANGPNKSSGPAWQPF